jgi:cytoskeletal protein CcmA (bactofilin family)
MAVLDESAFQSRIGKGTKFSGKLNFKAPAKIEGEAEGEITGEDMKI